MPGPDAPAEDSDDLHARIDALARDIERALQEMQETNDRWRGVFEQRSTRSRQLKQAYPEVTDEPRH
jgi:hypothetical protein